MLILFAVTKVLFLIELEFCAEFTVQSVGFVADNEDVGIVLQGLQNLNEVLHTIGIHTGIKGFIQNQ